MIAIKLSERQRRLAKMISENAVGGVISNPNRFWEYAGYHDKKSAGAIISTFCSEKGLLARVRQNTYRVLFSLAPDGRAVIQGEKIVGEAKALPECCAFLLLTPEEKDLFDELIKIQLPENDRLRERDLACHQHNAEDRESFCQKMIRCGVLKLVHGKTTKGKLFDVDRERIEALASKITIMADVEFILSELKGQWKSIDAVLSIVAASKVPLNAAFKPVKANEIDHSDGWEGAVTKLKNSQQEIAKRMAIFQLLADLDERGKIEIMGRLTSLRK